MAGQILARNDREKINPKFLCTVCKLLLKEPCQTTCGHLMCSACVLAILASSNPVCPEDESEIRKEEVFPDRFTNRELQGLTLHCPNDSCDWSGTNLDLQAHLENCGHALIQCVHEQCKTEIKRSLLAEHLKKDCNYRLTACMYCNETMAIMTMKEHIEESCVSAPVICQHCSKDVARGELREHEKLECNEIPVTCEFGDVGCTLDTVVKRPQLGQHYKKSLMVHVQLLLRFVLGMLQELKNVVMKMEVVAVVENTVNDLKEITLFLKQEVKSLAEKLGLLLKRVVGVETAISRLEERMEVERGAGGGGGTDVAVLVESLEAVREKNMWLENELRQRSLVIDRLGTKLEQMDQSMAETTVKISDMEIGGNMGQDFGMNNGTLLWKIDEFARKRQEAVNGNMAAIYSPHFYSSQFGYKMCVRIYMNGDGFGKGTHISLFFVVMRSDYDALLPWPFQKKITMMILDQVNGDHMIDAFRSDPDSSSFQRPHNKMNIASGSPLFLPLDRLNNRGYVKDDVMFVKVIVE